MTRVTEVASCTMAAAHRRDHEHRLRADHCHPHVVEVVPWAAAQSRCAMTAGSTRGCCTSRGSRWAATESRRAR